MLPIPPDEMKVCLHNEAPRSTLLTAQTKSKYGVVKLCPIDKKLLNWHLSRKDVREHPIIRDMGPGDKQNKYYSAVKRRIQDACTPEKIAITTPYAVQTQLMSPRLSTLLVYSGEFKPAEHLKAFVSSRTSVPLAIDNLKTIVSNVMQFGPDSVPPLPDRTPSRPEKSARRGCSISNVPVDPNAVDEWIYVDGKWMVI